MPIFNFFKKKNKDISKFSDGKTNYETTPPSQDHNNIISVAEAETELNTINEKIINSYLGRLQKTFEETNQVYYSINFIADSLDNEEIITEEEKLTPLVKNTKNTIVRALKRESSNILPIPQTFEDFTKFKDSVDASINRFGEVTSSHSRIVNTFMKKHANNLRSELKKISEYSDELKEFHNKISQKIDSINKCKNNLSNISDKLDEIQDIENNLINTENSITINEDEIRKKRKEIEKLKTSSEFDQSMLYKSSKEKMEKEKKEMINELNEISNHLSKAAHKYSYGISKGTVEKIQLLVNNPSKIINESDISPYLTILTDIKNSLKTNKIVLKDSTKVIQYCDILAKELPKYSIKIKNLDQKIEEIEEKDKTTIFIKIDNLENEIKTSEKHLEIFKSRKEELTREKKEIEEKLNDMLNETEEHMFDLCKKKYNISTQQTHN